jgi:ubiquinone/menaquinone biosynthesis C-methylase UbiE
MDYIRCPACIGYLRLTIEKRKGTEVVQGILECVSCEKCFEIKDGLPNLIFPEILEESDLQQQIRFDQEPKYDFRPRAFVLGIWEFAFFETRIRSQIINRLELKKNDSVLETGIGTGRNIPIMAKLIGKNGRLDGMDISSETMKVARTRMKAKDIQVEFIQGNASYLPYKTAEFNAVLHLGAFNEFGDKKRALEEMYRVAKPGSKIVICDEGLAPGKEKTLWGKWILSFIPSFADKPPADISPMGIEDFKIYWIQRGTAWVIEFRKKL